MMPRTINAKISSVEQLPSLVNKSGGITALHYTYFVNVNVKKVKAGS